MPVRGPSHSTTTRAFISLPSWHELREPGRSVTNAILAANVGTYLWATLIASARERSALYLVRRMQAWWCHVVPGAYPAVPPCIKRRSCMHACRRACMHARP